MPFTLDLALPAAVAQLCVGHMQEFHPDLFLSRVAELASVPLCDPADDEDLWRRTDAELGLVVPLDVKIMIQTFSRGWFGDFWFLSPHSPHFVSALSRRGVEFFHDAFSPIASEIAMPLYPDDCGWLRVGATGNRMNLMIRVHTDAVPPYEIAWLFEDQPVLRRLDIPVAEFLYQLFHNRIPSEWANYVRSLLWSEGDPFFRPSAQ